MKSNDALTTEEVASALKVSKLTVYDLIKKGKLPSYRVGRQIRVERSALEQYKQQGPYKPQHLLQIPDRKEIIIQGQDYALDILGKHLEQQSNEIRALRSNSSSLDGLIALYQGKTDIVSTHLFDGDTGSYNIPYIRKLFVSKSIIVIHLFKRKAGLYVAEGNPRNILSWEDLAKKPLTMINREGGAGARVLLDEKLRVMQINPKEITGYDQVVTTHFDVASAIAAQQADVGVGTLQAAKMTDVDFIPLMDESYDIVLLNTHGNTELIKQILTITSDATFHHALQALGHDTSKTGTIIYQQ